ncbi:hypothetical protein PR048_018684 [Dryococelus australis]|uniref:Uncharacterized protein n=1 Tax=Dryococelus australis TaxID=614101 RepID=A0ABQ9HCZ1_9NEOP|nr:hypothetical protein PR048_018684 [Dryococelus australis]
MTNLQKISKLCHFPTKQLRITRMTGEIIKQLDAQLSKKIVLCKYFSVAFNESTDITRVCKLLIFLRQLMNSSPLRKNCLPLPTSAKGSDSYSALVSVVKKYGGFSKCSCIVTDGAKFMTGKNTGLVGLLRKNDVDMPVLHCIIHQEVICSKFVKMNDVVKDVTRIVSLIRGGNRARKFLKELSAECHDILLYSEIHWLSASKTLTAFFAIKKEITEFLENFGKIECDYLKNFEMKNGFALQLSYQTLQNI